jgi:MFS family permease
MRASILMIALFVGQTNATLAKPFIQFYILETITTDPNLVVWIYIPSGIVAMILAPKMGKLADRVNPRWGVSMTSILGAFATFLLINTYFPAGFMLVMILDNTMSTTSNLVVENLVSRVSKSHRGRLFGYKYIFVQSGGIFGPLLGGLALEQLGLTWPFIISIYVEIALIPIFLLAMTLILPHLAEK